MVNKEKIRKGPWTEQEDLQLVRLVHLFGERRWDFLAKVSGLNRTGKSCRLRWVNYLHPSLKHGRMTPQEEQLIVDLHEKWGNRWSKIAGELPGRTDNEIKNYWRTHTRKKAQEEKASLLSSSSSISNNDESQLTSIEQFENEASMQGCLEEKIGYEKYATIDMASELIFEEYEDIGCYNDGNGLCSTWPSPVWEYNPEPLWMDG